MLKDITLGQYFPMDSVVHKMDARYKIIITLIFLVMLFWGQHIVSLAAGIFFVIAATAASRIPPKMLINRIRPIVPILIITGLMNLLLLDGGKEYFRWKFISITEEGLQTSAFMIVRICLLTDAIESLLSPLKKLKMPVHELAMMMTIALRFIPTLIEETDKIMSAQKARGADMESGGIVQRARALIPILIPLFVSAFRRAEELALAMECRCYHGGEGRTRLRELKSGMRDYIALALMILLFAAVIVLNAVLY